MHEKQHSSPDGLTVGINCLRTRQNIKLSIVNIIYTELTVNPLHKLSTYVRIQLQHVLTICPSA